MKTNLKKALSLVIVILMLVQFVPMNALAADAVRVDLVPSSTIVALNSVFEMEIVLANTNLLPDVYNTGSDPKGGLQGIEFYEEYDSTGFTPVAYTSPAASFRIGSENTFTDLTANLSYNANVIMCLGMTPSGTRLNETNDTDGDNKISLYKSQFRATKVGTYVFKSADMGGNISALCIDNDGNALYDLPDSSVEVKVVDVPTVPANLNAVGGKNKVDLTWDAVTDAASYNIKYSTASDLSSATTINVTTNSASIPGLLSNTPYYFAVQSNNVAGSSDYSGTVSATTLDTHKVIYNLNTGTGSVPIEGSEYENGELVNVMFTPAPTKDGYTFAGWDTNSSAASASYTSGGTTSFNMGTGDMNLYAIWTIDSYTVTYNYNYTGAAEPYTTQSADHGGTLTAPTDPLRTNYTFVKWYKEAACTNEWIFASDTATANTTLYAKWTLDSRTITLDENGGDPISDITQDYGTTVTDAPAITRAGYKFEGWCSDSELNTAVEFPYTVAGNATWYAKWTVNSHTVTYNYNYTGAAEPYTTQSVDHGSTLTVPDEPLRTNYTFVKWYKEAACTNEWKLLTDTVTANTTLYAKWTLLPVAFECLGSARTVDFTTGGTTYNLIRGISANGDSVKTAMSTYFKITNGSWKLYTMNPTGAYTEVNDTDTTTEVGSGFKIEVYDLENNLYKTYYIAILGDLDCNGLINVQDVAAINKHQIGSKTIANNILLYCADVIAPTGSINLLDTLAIKCEISHEIRITQ